MKKDSKHYKIFIIEDNEGDFVIVEEFIKEQMSAAQIIHAETFKIASAILSAPDVSCDIILLDLTLPDNQGWGLINAISQLAPSCPIIVLTGYSNIDFSILSISQGISDYLIKDELNAAILYKSIIYSIERKKSILLLEQSERRYSDLFLLSPLPMWVFDVETLRFLQVNKASTEHYGYSEEEFLAMTILDCRPTDDTMQTMDFFNDLAGRKDQINSLKIRHQKKNGEIIDVEISSTPITIDERKCRSVIANDVTEKNLFELNLTKAIIKTQEDERYEIGGELHDNVCQILAAAQLNLGMLKGFAPTSKREWFDQCSEYIVLATHEIRNLSHRLAPAFFDNTSLEETLGKLLHSFNANDRYKLSLHLDAAVRKYDVDPSLQLNLYRILQEQLSNIQKYAMASNIKVEIAMVNNALLMTVSDDGVGMKIDDAKGGIGIANMKRRAALFTGNLAIISSPGQGCTLKIDIPLQVMKGARSALPKS